MAARALLSALAIALFLLPVVSAHTALKPKENEVHILSDFADDVSYEVGSWDLWNIYVGEASVPGLGDGFYFHTILFGDYARRLPGETEFKAKFTFQAPGGPVTRSLSTKDGNTLTGDFDALDFKKVATDFEVVRAFVSYAKAGLAQGMELKGWKVETYVDADLRDVAPGGYFMPKSGGKAEKPETSTIKAPSYTLAGAGAYFSVKTSPAKDGQVALAVQNLFKDTAQLVKLDVPSSASWEIKAVGESAVQLPGGKASVLQVQLTPKPDASGLVAPVAFNLTSDLGGRVGLVAHVANGAPAVGAEGIQVASAKLASAPAESPGVGGAWVVLAVLAVGVALARRKP
ncbi:MAG TPA: hypothetical protein VI818_05840 [Candidatus Thermoplasmatota archaeon]|nr:hypothetical protein [Candidatus Thermoplasmatota archaeon]